MGVSEVQEWGGGFNFLLMLLGIFQIFSENTFELIIKAKCVPMTFP